MNTAIKIQVNPSGHRFGQINMQRIFMIFLVAPENGNNHGLQFIEEADQMVKADFFACANTDFLPGPGRLLCGCIHTQQKATSERQAGKDHQMGDRALILVVSCPCL